MKFVNLSQVAFVNMGTAPPGNTYNMNGNGTPMIAGAGDYGETYPSPKKWTTKPTRLANKGDLIVCVRATIGDLNWADKEYCLGRGVAGIKPKEDKLNIRYLAHYINLKKMKLASLGTGSTFLAIRKNDLEDFPIPLPPLDEQIRIAGILDKAAALRRKREQAYQLAQTFLKSLFINMFKDDNSSLTNATLCDLISTSDKINYGVVQPGKDFVNGTPIIRVGDFSNGRIDVSNLKLINPILDEKHSKSRINGSEILVACVGATLGKLAIIDKSLVGCNIARAVARIPIKETSLRYYLFYYLQLPEVQNYFKGESRIVGQPTLNLEQIRLLKIPLPPHSIQNKFASIAQRFTQTQQKLNSTLDNEIQNLNGSLQSQLLSTRD